MRRLRHLTREESRDVHGVFRRPLSIVLDAVGRDVVEQRGAMLARRAHSNEIGVLSNERFERRHIAGDDRVDRRFELSPSRVARERCRR